jgi:hypothetical protein
MPPCSNTSKRKYARLDKIPNKTHMRRCLKDHSIRPVGKDASREDIKDKTEKCRESDLKYNRRVYCWIQATRKSFSSKNNDTIFILAKKSKTNPGLFKTRIGLVPTRNFNNPNGWVYYLYENQVAVPYIAIPRKV